MANSANDGCERLIPWFAPWLAAPKGSAGAWKQTEVTTREAKDAGQQQFAFAVPRDALRDSKLRKLGLPLSQTDGSEIKVTYDVKTSLPSRMDFVDYPSSDDTRKIETYVLFSDYRAEQGVMIPHHIERYVQRTLESDIHITGVSTR